MEQKFWVVAGMAMAAFGPSPVQALEKFATYDTFNAPAIDQTLWPGYLDRAREIRGNKLRLMSRDYGATTSDTGSTSTNWIQSLLNPAKITEMRATLIVNAVDVEACASNTTPGVARARLFGEFFNTATPTPGSAINDVTAQFRVLRGSDSTDPPDVLHAEGAVFLCKDSACANVTELGRVDLGTVALGQPLKAQMQWDKLNKRFLFKRDDGTAMVVKYAVSDVDPPGSPSAHIGIRHNVPNCASAARPSAMMDVSFDGVAVNASAVP